MKPQLSYASDIYKMLKFQDFVFNKNIIEKNSRISTNRILSGNVFITPFGPRYKYYEINTRTVVHDQAMLNRCVFKSVLKVLQFSRGMQKFTAACSYTLSTFVFMLY